MLKALTLENFKCFGRATRIPFAPITLIYGQNSAGKSSILQALYLLKQTAEHAPPDCALLFRCEGGLVDLGNYRSAVHDHDERKELGVRIDATGGLRATAKAFLVLDGTERHTSDDPGCYCNYRFRCDNGSIALDSLIVGDDDTTVECRGIDGSSVALRTMQPSRVLTNACEYLRKKRSALLERIPLAVVRDTLKDVDPNGDIYWRYMDEELTNRTVRESVTLDGRSAAPAPPAPDRELDAGSIAYALYHAAQPRKSLNPGGQVLLAQWTQEQRQALLEAHRCAIERLKQLPQYQSAAGKHQENWSHLLKRCKDDPVSWFKAAPGEEFSCRGLRAKHERARSLVLAKDLVRLTASDAFLYPPLPYEEPVHDPWGETEVVAGCLNWRMDNLDRSDEHIRSEDEDYPDLRPPDFYPVEIFCNIIVDELQKLRPLAPVRRAPERIHVDSGLRPSKVGFQGEWLTEVLLANPATVDASNTWLKRLTGYTVSVKSLGSFDAYALQLTDHRRQSPVDVSAVDVGYGIGQILPLIVESVSARDASITVEQPELHIHPRLQAELGDLLAESILQRGNQYIIETHSEHLMLRLQKLVRNGTLKPNDLSVLYVNRGDDGSTVQQIRLDDAGDFLDPWPDGFFPERLSEILG